MCSEFSDCSYWRCDMVKSPAGYAEQQFEFREAATCMKLRVVLL